MTGAWIMGTDLAADLAQIMRARPFFEGRVHSVFDRSVNVLTGADELVTMTVAGREVMPTGFAVDLEDTGPLGLKPGARVVFEGLNVRLSGRQTVSLRKARVQPVTIDAGLFRSFTPDPALAPLLKSILLEADSAGIASLAAWIPQGGDLPDRPGNLYCSFIARDLAAFAQALLEDDEEALPQRALRLIGFGPGLTPALDDFLSAVALVLYARGKGGLYLEELETLSGGRTTLVSSHMLKNAARGMANGLYRSLFESLAGGDPGGLEEAAGKVLGYGASSGADFLYGFYCALYAWIKQETVRS